MKRSKVVLGLMVLCALLVMSVSASAFGKKKVKILSTQPRFQEIYGKYVQQFEEKYNSENRKKIKIELESYPNSQYTTLLKSKLVVGDPVDIFHIHAVNEMSMYVKAGYLVDLEDTGIKSQLIDSMAEAVTVDNKIYGLPLESLLWGILYNKELFDELGLEPAKTMSELKYNTKKLKESGYTPFLLSYKEQWIPQLFLPLVVGPSAEKLNFVERMNNNDASFAEMKNEMFEVMDLVNANGNSKALDMSGVDGCNEFAKGKYGMWVQGPWFAETILSANADASFGVATLPIDENPDHALINQSISTTFVISKKSKNQEIAKEFLKYLLSSEASNDFYKEMKFNPAAKNHNFEVYPWVADAMEYVKRGESVMDPRVPQAVKDEAGKVFQAYYSGSMNQDEVITALDKAWQNFNKVNQ